MLPLPLGKLPEFDNFGAKTLPPKILKSGHLEKEIESVFYDILNTLYSLS